MEIWQIAAGDTQRSYQDICLRWDVAIIGPGHRGPWPDCRTPLIGDGCSSSVLNRVQQFHEEIRHGDIVVLHVGTRNVYGVGKVVSDEPLWSCNFGDIDGWDLQFVRRVKWLWSYNVDNNGVPKTFRTYALALRRTVCRLQNGLVSRWAASKVERSNVEDCNLTSSIETLPSNSGRCVEIQQIARFLLDNGIAADSVDSLINEISALRCIASWYDRANARVSEHETVVYLVVPLLRVLGWTHQKMAVEWGTTRKKVDVALFDQLPRDDRHLSVVVEVKKRNYGCLSAIEQAQTYANEGDRRQSCSKIIVTDGIRYGIYVRDQRGQFKNNPVAYLNINRMMDKYPVLECDGAPHALQLMAAGGRNS